MVIGVRPIAALVLDIAPGCKAVPELLAVWTTKQTDTPDLHSTLLFFSDLVTSDCQSRHLSICLSVTQLLDARNRFRYGTSKQLEIFQSARTTA